MRQALERGASDEEIKKLTEELRAALDKFLQALAEEMRKNPQMARPLDPNSMRQLRAQDLKSMIDRLEQLARSGAKDAARELLEQLQQMLENLQMARPGQMGDDGDDDMMSALDELGDMIRKQQQLRDRTFRQGQDQRRQQRGQRGQQGQQGQQGRHRTRYRRIAAEPAGLARPAQEAAGGVEAARSRAEPGRRPAGTGRRGTDSLGRAGDAMGDAEGALGDGNADGAVDGQGRALEALRKGAQGLAQQLQQQMGEGQGPGQPGRAAKPGAAGHRSARPSVARARLWRRHTVKVPGEIDVQRARRILEELRRRFGEASDRSSNSTTSSDC